MGKRPHDEDIATSMTHTSKGKPLKIDPKDVGSIKKRLLMEVIEHPESNTREHLVNYPQLKSQACHWQA